MKKEYTKKVLVRKINAEINFSEFKTSDSLPKTAATISARTFEYLDRSEYLTYQDSSFSGEDLKKKISLKKISVRSKHQASTIESKIDVRKLHQTRLGRAPRGSVS